MKTRLLLAAILTFATITGSFSQDHYEPTWESLDQRECPSWYSDAKFGIFIHWGLYSVPAYTMKGTYAEWYWHALNENPETATENAIVTAIKEYHDKRYGEGLSIINSEISLRASIRSRSGPLYSSVRGKVRCTHIETPRWILLVG